MKRVDHDCQHGASRSLQGLSGVGNVCVGRDIPELRARFCGCVNLNGILCNQEHPLVNQRGSLGPFHLLNQQGISVFLSAFNFFCPIFVSLLF